MQRLRVLRTLLPLFLVLFVVAVVLTLRSRPAGGKLPAEVVQQTGARASGFSFSDLLQGRRRLMVKARLGSMDNQGAFQVDEVQRVEVDRENQSPLVLTASHGTGSGAQGKRVMRLEGGVTVHDDDTGMDLAIPTVEMDQVEGVVRSLGEVKVTGPVWSGTASAVIYDLNGKPALLYGLAVDGQQGARMVAQKATVETLTKIITLEGQVDARQGGATLQAPVVVLKRGANGKLESADASSNVTGTMTSSTQGAGSFRAQQAHATWGPDGTVNAISLSGAAQIEHTKGQVAADRIDARADTADGGFIVDAAGNASLSGPTQKGMGQLTCTTLHGRLDAKGGIRDGVATGDVAFAGDGTSGEASDASFSSLEASGMVTLHSSPERRARLANARTRIAADTITSDLKGTKMVAQGRVDATLLPAQDDKGGQQATTPMFASGEAVHFVSAGFESMNGGTQLRFHGDVRGWQGDRTLAADDVEMIQEGQVLNANGHVASRMPRVAGHAASEADFIQVVSDKLAYKGSAHVAEYTGSVRVRQSEGWLEAPRLVANLNEDGKGLKDAQASGGVKFEYRSAGEKGVPTTATGDGDRAIYETAGRLMRLFGDKKPATVRNTGPSGGTTVGRVLRYHLDSGALEVESGGRDRATVNTPKS